VPAAPDGAGEDSGESGLPLPRVDDVFLSRHGLEHAAEQLHRASVGAYAALLAACTATVEAETKALLAASVIELPTHRGRLQLATEQLERITHYRERLAQATKRRTPL
jgi:hypothetical protein